MAHVANLRDSKDPWEVAQVSYSPDDIYTRSTDGKGHYETLRNVKVAGGLHSVLSQMIADQAFPELRSIGDVVRDALLHRCMFYKDNYQRLAQVTNADLVLANVQRRVERNQQRQDIVDNYRDQLRSFDHDGDWSSILDAVEQMGMLVDEWSDTRHGAELARVIDEYARTARSRMRLELA